MKSPSSPPVPVTASVAVYWNRHKKMWSVRSQSTRRVIAHALNLVLRDCEFRVSESGRQRVLATGKRNVHAVVVGARSSRGVSIASRTAQVSYNPFRSPHFINRQTGATITRSRSAHFQSDGTVVAVDPE